jgi:hypothetical protein
MFKKKGLERAIFDINRYFGYLFEDGFKTVGTKYEPQHFGNWMIVLHSSKCGIRIHQDRREIFVIIGPPWASSNLNETDHYYDLRLIVAFLENSELINMDSDLRNIESQYEKLAEQLLRYYNQIISLINRSDFANIEKELLIYGNKILSKRYPQLFKGKSIE